MIQIRPYELASDIPGIAFVTDLCGRTIGISGKMPETVFGIKTLNKHLRFAAEDISGGRNAVTAVFPGIEFPETAFAVRDGEYIVWFLTHGLGGMHLRNAERKILDAAADGFAASVRLICEDGVTSPCELFAAAAEAVAERAFGDYIDAVSFAEITALCIRILFEDDIAKLPSDAPAEAAADDPHGAFLSLGIFLCEIFRGYRDFGIRYGDGGFSFIADGKTVSSCRFSLPEPHGKVTSVEPYTYTYRSAAVAAAGVSGLEISPEIYGIIAGNAGFFE